MRIPIPSVALLLAAALPWSSGCGDDSGPTGPEAGILEVSLTTPNGNDAAIVLRLTGPGISQVRASDGDHYFHLVESGSGVTVVLVGDLPAGGIVRFSVPDVEAVDSYSAAILEVADESNALRASLSGYEVNVAQWVGSLPD
jgi:hypothetical protein